MAAFSDNAELSADPHQDSPGAPTPDQPIDEHRSVENTEFAAFVRRIIRAHGRRIAGGDVDGLADLIHVETELHDAIDAAARQLHDDGYSWTEIAERLDVTRQAARQRWAS